MASKSQERQRPPFALEPSSAASSSKRQPSTSRSERRPPAAPAAPARTFFGRGQRTRLGQTCFLAAFGLLLASSLSLLLALFSLSFYSA